VHGYDAETGIPTRERLEQLGLKKVADELEVHAPYPEWDGPPLWPLEKHPPGGSKDCLGKRHSKSKLEEGKMLDISNYQPFKVYEGIETRRMKNKNIRWAEFEPEK
jgi:hypothetical protein